jgi:redox-sensitive bicupin YhaK (pirin superfamily)
VAVRSPMLYLDIALAAGDALPLPLAAERALYAVQGAVLLDGQGRPVPWCCWHRATNPCSPPKQRPSWC